MRKIVILLLAVTLLTGKVWALDFIDEQAELFGIDDLEDRLPSAAEAYLDGVLTDGQASLSDGVTEILTDTISGSGEYLRTSLRLMLRVLVILILCRLVGFGENEGVRRACVMTGVLALTACCAADLRIMIGLGRSTMEEMMSFSSVLLPVMAAAASASGAVTGAGTLYAVAVVFSKLLIGFSGKVLIPMVYGYLALGVTDAALQETRLTKLRELLGWVIGWGLKGVMYLFTGFLTLSGVLAGSVDGATLKAAKVTISKMVPVVGGIISGAAETLLYGAGLLKSAIGVFGVLAILAVFLVPFLRMTLHFFVLKLTAAIGGVLGSELTAFMECISGAMGFLLAMLGSCGLMCLLSCCCFLRVVGV